LKSGIKSSILNTINNVVPFFDKSKCIFALDCPRQDIWRRDIFPEYKLQRDNKDKSKDRYNIGQCFNYAYKYIIPKLCDEFNCISLKCGCAEGDDIIAVLSKYLTTGTKNKCTIISADRDMVQLCDENISLVTIDGKIRSPKEDLEKLTLTKFKGREITAQDFLLFKILIGDPSDNIPNVKPGIGKKKALTYLFDKVALKQLLLEDKIYLDGFKRNKLLISMNDIPVEIKDLIIQDYNNLIEDRNKKMLFTN